MMEEDRTVEDYCQSIKQKMRDIVNSDNKNNKKGLPAMQKIKTVETFFNILINKKYQEILLDENILEVVREWLEPLPDGTYPNIKIKKSLMEAMKYMPIQKDHLLESGVGRIVYFYSLNGKEEKKTAHDLVKKWIGEIFGGGDSRD